MGHCFRKRPLTTSQLNYYAEHLSELESEEEPFQESESEYIESEEDTSSESDLDIPKRRKIDADENISSSNILQNLIVSGTSSDEGGTSSDEDLDNTNTDIPVNAPGKQIILWKDVNDQFIPRMKIPDERNCTILGNLDRGSSELDIFFKLFPKSLFQYIAQCTNERLDILEHAMKKQQKHTDSHEIMIVIGCLFIMSYNRVPAIHLYWSSNKSLGNEAIKLAISRDRFQLLNSKMYYNSPKKPNSASKLYYIEDVVCCLKKTFINARSECAHQSIDESMAKFKGRSVLKQYLPLKPIKRGIKIWQRCDSKTGYVYDFNIYAGKEPENTDGTLGERVVRKLTESIRESNVSLCFDRFFTSVNLLDTLKFPAVGTCIATRKNMPRFAKKKRNRGDIECMENQNGTIGFLWKDTKEVMLLSNCHQNKAVEIGRRGKDGDKISLQCPEAIQFYNTNMGGVDLSDQLTELYDVDRKSLKWWKKVFYKLLLTAAVNAWIICKELRNKPSMPFLSFLVNLAEALISKGRENASVIRKRSYGRSNLSSKNLLNVGDHLPVMIPTRRRCKSCSQKKVEMRTKTMCSACNIPLCNKCFFSYHR